MAKEFDIYLNKRLTECDIIVYSIPYRDGLTAMNRLILESCLENYLLQKFVAVQTGSDLISRIDKMIKTCYERLNLNTGIDITAEFQTHYTAYPLPNKIEVGAEDIDMLATGFIDAGNNLILKAAPLYVSVGKSLGYGKSDIVTDVEMTNILKRSIEQANNGVIFDSSNLGSIAEKKIVVKPATVLSANLANLCYRITTMIDTTLELTASVLGTELHFSFGHAYSGIAIGAKVNATESQKFEVVEAAVTILYEAVESLQQFFFPDSSVVYIGFDADAIIKRHRLLSVMDSDLLSEYDDMTLDEVDYVLL